MAARPVYSSVITGAPHGKLDSAEVGTPGEHANTLLASAFVGWKSFVGVLG